VLIGERGLVVYGPNGVGKSSLVDAIEFALTNDSTLYAEKRQGVNWQVGAPHIRGGRMSVYRGGISMETWNKRLKSAI
jgi:recombinational DNA repair ATPase RecF